MREPIIPFYLNLYIENPGQVVERQLEDNWCGLSFCGQWCAWLVSRPVPDVVVSRLLAEEAAAEIPKKLVTLGIDAHVEKRFTAQHLVVLRIDVKSIDSARIISTQVSATTSSWVNAVVEQLGAKGILDGALKMQVEKAVLQKLPEEIGSALAEQGITARIYAEEDDHEANTFFALVNNEVEATASVRS